MAGGRGRGPRSRASPAPTRSLRARDGAAPPLPALPASSPACPGAALRAGEPGPEEERKEGRKRREKRRREKRIEEEKRRKEGEEKGSRGAEEETQDRQAEERTALARQHPKARVGTRAASAAPRMVTGPRRGRSPPASRLRRPTAPEPRRNHAQILPGQEGQT